MDSREYSMLYDKLRAEYSTPIQVKDEFWELVQHVMRIGPTNVLEIGVENGGTIKFWDEIVGEDGKIIGLDLCTGKVVMPRDFLSDLELIEGDSHSLKVVELIKSKMPVVDFLFIDGDHSYDGVKADFENFSPLVRPGGLVGFHDIFDGAGVGDFWKEMERTYRTGKYYQKAPEGIGIGFIPWE